MIALRYRRTLGHRRPRARYGSSSDSPLEGTGFEPVWGFSCQVVFWVVVGSLFGAGKRFFVPSPEIRFAERAEGVKEPQTVAKLSGVPLSGACVSQRLEA